MLHKLQEIASNESSELYTNRLVYLNPLRAIPLTHKNFLNLTKRLLKVLRNLKSPSTISYDGIITFNPEKKDNIIPGEKYVISLKLKTKAGEHLYADAVTFNVISKPLKLQYAPNEGSRWPGDHPPKGVQHRYAGALQAWFCT